jgi:hypothetical protein
MENSFSGSASASMLESPSQKIGISSVPRCNWQRAYVRRHSRVRSSPPTLCGS